MAVFSASIFPIAASNAACEEVLLEVVTSAIIEFTSLTAIDAAELVLDDVALDAAEELSLVAELALEDVALLLETDEAELAAELVLDDVALDAAEELSLVAELALEDVALLLETDEAELAAELVLDPVAEELVRATSSVCPWPVVAA
ncbi:hypothetical protein ATX59_10225 [Oenococcus oeni]|uniref:Uncharacterized protein n=2 Tax=Oenococcus oeni TaxID=1247 RepID=A0A6N3ZYT1_OENOE|nr:hypothetical protein ATX59_10225 [Oenococcus oeni]